MEEKNERRVGTYTFGVMLIIIGISVLIMTFTKIDFFRYLLMVWPIVLIGLGIEILYLNSKSNIRVKIDFISIILMGIVLLCTAVFSLGNYFVNKVLYDEDIKGKVFNQYFDRNYYESYEESDNENLKDMEYDKIL